ncbi:5-oxoprolinase subunit PxpB [Panacibacter sp. DH6]|uniref:5-oxoprolinase subunit PxpB n=1 Tax=Panacibacter microcysteis TaxID=2793269 RepID=A0A931H0A3_9BACT|nr:5-oxoprolinase subunit PxpB [Panacibacter microcysteis]
MHILGDHAVTVSFGDDIDEDINRKVTTLFHCLKQQKFAGITDLIPAYATLTIVYDIVTIAKEQQDIEGYFNAIVNKALTGQEVPDTLSSHHEIPVCYDVVFAPDLLLVARKNRLSIADVIHIHAGKTYRVYMIGFLPGFAYMGSVDSMIATPRLEKPRQHVAAGSVGIAGSQTGIYPVASPGGWNIIGRTPVKMFNVNNSAPCYLNAGDTVQFVSISKTDFEELINKR